MARCGVGGRVPEVRLAQLDGGDMVKGISLHDLLARKRAIGIGVPGAFTPVCTRQHIPGFVRHAEKLR